jgi:hypothetical protein
MKSKTTCEFVSSGLSCKQPELKTLCDSKRLADSRKAAQQDVDHLSRVLNDLDELGDIMGEMLATQNTVEARLSGSSYRRAIVMTMGF